MANPLQLLDRTFVAAMRCAFGGALPAEASAMLSPSRDARFGDFQSTAAMPLAKSLGKPPRDVAAAIVAELKKDPEFAAIADPPEIAGPGFINIRLKPAALADALAALDTPALGVEPPAPDERETVVVDLCGVNLAKQMHVGHLRATVIGDALARLWERLGHRVIRQNHFGDWGLPIAMVTEAVKRGVEKGEVHLEALTLDALERMYRQAQRDCETSESELAAAKAALVALQAHDPAYTRLWERIRDITLSACFDICRRLHANVTAEATAGESDYAAELPQVVADLVDRGVAEESEGALVIRLDEFGIKEPCIIRKRDGGYLYATTDIAGIRRRVQRLGADRVIYAVDARQSFHFRQVFAACRKAGYTRRTKGEAALIHAAFGTVLGEDGTPFKTRSGENVRLADLLDEAVSRAEAAVMQKNPDLPADQRRRIAEAVGIGAIKYADLVSDRIKDYVFSFDRMLAFEGNTGPYLQYALVRVRSIFRKAKEQFGIEETDTEQGATASEAGRGGRPEASATADFARRLASLAVAPFVVSAPQERGVALQLLKYPGVVRAAADSCEPHRLCGYLYDLAGAFSGFFESCPVLQAADERTRLARLRLCRLTGRVLKDGLETLGIVPLERM